MITPPQLHENRVLIAKKVIYKESCLKPIYSSSNNNNNNILYQNNLHNSSIVKEKELMLGIQ